MKQRRKLFWSVLAGAMLTAASMGSAFAAPETSSAFDVTVPVAMPVSIAADGTVTTSTNLKITNNCSNGRAVGVSQIDVSAAEGWTLASYNTGAVVQNTVDQKDVSFSLSVNGEEGHTTKQGSAETIVSHAAGSFGAMTANAGDSMPIAYDVEIGPQTESLTDVTVMSVVFTIDYVPLDNEPLPYDPENTGSSIYSDHWITSENRGDSLIVTVPTLANSDGSNMNSVDPNEHVFQFLLEDKTSGSSPEPLDGVLNITTPYETGKYYSTYTGAKFTVSVKSDDEINAWAFGNAGDANRLKELAAMFRAVMDNQGTDVAASAGIDLNGDGTADHKLRLYISLKDGTEYADFEIPRYYSLTGYIESFAPMHIATFTLAEENPSAGSVPMEYIAYKQEKLGAGMWRQDFKIYLTSDWSKLKGRSFALNIKKAGHVTYDRTAIILDKTLCHPETGENLYDANTLEFSFDEPILLFCGDVDGTNSVKARDVDQLEFMINKEVPWTKVTDPTDSGWSTSVYNPDSFAYACDLNGDGRITRLDRDIIFETINYNKDQSDYGAPTGLALTKEEAR